MMTTVAIMGWSAPAQKSVVLPLLVLLLASVSTGGWVLEGDPTFRGPEDRFTNDSGAQPDQGGSAGPAENIVQGEVYLVTPEATRIWTAQSLNGATHDRVNVVGGGPFELRPQREASRACLGSDCVESPDFDIAFFRDYEGSSARVGDRHYNVGMEEGFVPARADFAHVYLRTSGLVPDNLRGYSFVYLQGNPESDVVPDWDG